MANLNLVNIGNLVNDGTGDDLRTAFQKVNANFSDLNTELTITASNAGPVGARVFKEKVGADLQFRNIVSGTKILAVEATDSIIINSTAPDAFFRFDTNAGSMIAGSGNNGGQITVAGPPGGDVSVTTLGSTMFIDTKRINNKSFTQILSYIDFGPITGAFENTLQFAAASANVDFGTLSLPSRFDLDCGELE